MYCLLQENLRPSPNRIMQSALLVKQNILYDAPVYWSISFGQTLRLALIPKFTHNDHNTTENSF